MTQIRTSYGVRERSHWQGSTPGPVLATFTLTPDGKQAAESLVDRLSTCSFCTPGRSGNYQVGRCYEVVYSWREVGYLAPDWDQEALTGLAG